ncbi:GNAT family N-acetyltransferase [Vibrio cholerae]|nr:GNAT family N-acetyltransferase [Vibrio cholerae]
MSDTSDIQVSNDEAQSHYVAQLDGEQVGTAAYELTDDTIVFTHTIVDEDVEGRGVGSTLIGYALDDARGRQLTVVPQCGFVAAFIDEHPDYQDLLA